MYNEIDVTHALEVIGRGAVEIIAQEELRLRLQQSRPLTVKVGFDPTAPDLHFGHTVLLHKMRQFQDLGHKVIFLLGDFTGMIGDPSGRNEMRPSLTREQVLANAASYAQQVYKVLDQQKTQVLFNSSWCAELKALDMIKLASAQTVARILERDDFSKRYAQQRPIALHEFFYPLLQGYDSVHLRADIELGGIDQKFNLLMGRQLQQYFGQLPQIVIMLPLLLGLDGVKKMSKSLGNYIGVTESAATIFGKIMSIADPTMWEYFKLLSTRSSAAIAQLRAQVADGMNPRDVKLLLAEELSARFHDAAAAKLARENFLARFQRGLIPDDLPIQYVEAEPGGINIVALLKASGLVASSSEAIRLLQQGAVRIDGNKILDRKQVFCHNQPLVIQVGRQRIAKIIIN
jgi:tyrosyl-tRNA synthetase